MRNARFKTLILIFHNLPLSLFVLGLLIAPVTSDFPPGMNNVYLRQNKKLLSIIELTIKSSLLHLFAFMQVLVMDTPT